MKLDPNYFIHVSIHDQFIDYCSIAEYDLLNPNNIFILEDQENCIHKIESFNETLKFTNYQYQQKNLQSNLLINDIILETIDHKIYKYLVAIK